MNEFTDSDGDAEAEIRKYVRNNREFLSQVLRHGDTNARGYALALLANSGSDDDIGKVQQALENMKDSKE